MSKPKRFVYINDKCNPNVDMGKALIFAEPIPGLNETEVRPFGWSEYESAYRPQYVPDPVSLRRPCKDPCKTKVKRNPAPRQFQKPCRKNIRIGICGYCQMGRCSCEVPAPWNELREKVVVYDPDSVRDLYIHNELKTEHPVVVSQDQYCRILNAAIVKSKEERDEECKENERMRLMNLLKCRELAEEMRFIDKCRINDTLSPEAREDQNEILCRSHTIIKNDAPEVRTINQVILAAKVQAIREAQKEEKFLIRCEEAEEEARLFELLKQDKGHNLIKDDEEEEEIIEAKKRVASENLRLQLEEKEAYKYLDKKLQEAERKELKKKWELEEMEDMEKRILEIEKKHKLGKELMENQVEMMRMRKELKEFDREEDRRLTKWQEERAAAEEEAEKAKKEEKRLKALAFREAGEAQKRQLDSKAFRDELRARRHQEEEEREWRRRERESILKRERERERLRELLLEQIEKKQEGVCEEAAYEKAEYDKLYDLQSQNYEEEKKREDERRIKNAEYRLLLREQIHDYQLRKIEERKCHFIEGINLRKDLAIRDNELKCTMEEKLEELRESNLPEKYINYVRKAVHEELKPTWQKSMSKK